MKTYQLYLLILIALCSCSSRGQQPDNTKPMYGEVQKSAEYEKVDAKFKKECLDEFKTIDSSVKVQIDHAWRYFYHNDLKTAMKRFNQAWLLDSTIADSYFGFAALLEMQNDRAQAKRFYSIAEQKDISNERAIICYQRIADCKEQLQDIKGTLTAYKKLSEVNPNNGFAFKKMGYFQSSLGDLENALNSYSKAIELDPKDPMTYNNRGYLYQKEKKYKDAIADYTRAIEIDSKYISAYVNRGTTFMEQLNFEAAKKDYEVAVQLDNNSGELRRILGLSKLSLTDRRGACQDFQLAKQLGDELAAQLLTEHCK